MDLAVEKHPCWSVGLVALVAPAQRSVHWFTTTCIPGTSGLHTSILRKPFLSVKCHRTGVNMAGEDGMAGETENIEYSIVPMSN